MSKLTQSKGDDVHNYKIQLKEVLAKNSEAYLSLVWTKINERFQDAPIDSDRDVVKGLVEDALRYGYLQALTQVNHIVATLDQS